MEWELSLQFCLSASPHRMEQSWPTRDAGAAQESRHLAAQVGVLPTHRCIGCCTVLWSRDHILALVAEDLEGFVEGSVEARGRSGSYECHDLRGARPLAPGYSSDSFPNRCPPNDATAFPRVSGAHRSDLAPRSLAKPGWPSSSAYRPLRA